MILTVYAPSSRYDDSANDVLRQGGVLCSQEALISTTTTDVSEDTADPVACRYFDMGTNSGTLAAGESYNMTATGNYSITQNLTTSTAVPISPLVSPACSCDCTESSVACCLDTSTVKQEAQGLNTRQARSTYGRCCNATNGRIELGESINATFCLSEHTGLGASS